MTSVTPNWTTYDERMDMAVPAQTDQFPYMMQTPYGQVPYSPAPSATQPYTSPFFTSTMPASPTMPAAPMLPDTTGMTPGTPAAPGYPATYMPSPPTTLPAYPSDVTPLDPSQTEIDIAAQAAQDQTLIDPNYLPGYLRQNIGKWMRVDFYIGNTLDDRSGWLKEVGSNYIVLGSIRNDVRSVCDLYSIKFVTIVEHIADAMANEMINQPNNVFLTPYGFQ